MGLTVGDSDLQLGKIYGALVPHGHFSLQFLLIASFGNALAFVLIPWEHRGCRGDGFSSFLGELISSWCPIPETPHT